VSDLTKQLAELEKERKKLSDQAEDMKKKEKVLIFFVFPNALLKALIVLIKIVT
jgi:hypothetical protein